MNNTSSSSDLLLQKRRDKFNDWKVRFVEKYGNEPSLNDIEKYPKVKRIYQEIKTLSATATASYANSPVQDILLQEQAQSQPIAATLALSEVILPTPSKDRSTFANQKRGGLFKSLSSSNVLLTKRFAAMADDRQEMEQENPPKKLKIAFSTAGVDALPPFGAGTSLVQPQKSTSWNSGTKSQDVDIEKMSNGANSNLLKRFQSAITTNAFGLQIKKACSPALVPGVTIEEDEPSGNDKNVIKKLVAQEFHFGISSNKSKMSATSPNDSYVSIPSITVQDHHENIQKERKTASAADLGLLKSSKPSPVAKLKSPRPGTLQSPLPPSKNWRIFKPIATPLKKVVENAMKPAISKQRADTFIAPHMFVNHRTLKRAASLTLPLPSNYQDFLTKEEERQFADIIRSQDPNAVPDEGEKVSSANDVIETIMDDEVMFTDTKNCLKPVVTAKPTMKDHGSAVVESIPSSVARLSAKPRARKGSVPPRSPLSEDYGTVDIGSSSNSSAGEEDDEEVEEIRPKRKQANPTRKSTASPKRATKTSAKSAKPSTKSESAATSIASGWNSKSNSKASVRGGNQNYRAFNLKPKKGGGSRSNQSSSKFGKNKFKKTKKLSSYNYKASDMQYLLAGYEEESNAAGQSDDVVVDGGTLRVVDPSSFIIPKSGAGVAAEQEKDLPLCANEDAEGESVVCAISDQYEPCQEKVEINLLEALKILTGHTSFRDGQMKVIKRILEYKSTIFILPTGGGKSLCYQLPAFILRHIPKKRHSMVLIISPTISLMMDQLHCLPKGIRGACLSSSDQGAAANKVLDKLKKCEVDVLFISPERLRTDSFLSLVQNGVLPAISFVCVDEVHCLSEWSHNFRTSYLHLQSSLLNTLQVGCILGLTGTATIASQQSICRMLAVDQAAGVVSHGFLRNNLLLSASMIQEAENREASLAELLRTKPYEKFQSIIIYVMFQNQADQLAQYLRVRDFDAESYHAGKDTEVRSQTQSRFLRGSLRILTATVAFGMGINKPNIDAVIHYCLPKSVENYIQETGRAGRDGREAYCHVFVSRQDYVKHRSLVYSEYFDEGNLMKFLRMIFATKGKRVVGINIQESERLYDVKEGVLATVLSHIELDYPELLHVLPATNGTISLWFSTGTSLEELCKEIDWFWEISKSHSQTRGGIEFDLIRVANAAGMMPRDVMAALWGLQNAKKIRFKSDGRVLQAQLLRADVVQVDFIRKLSQSIHKKLFQMEQIKVLKLDETYEMLNKIAVPSTHMIQEVEDLEERRSSLKGSMAAYFDRSGADELTASQLKSKWGFRDTLLIENQKIWQVPQMAVEIAIKQFVRMNHACLDSGRTVARVFHGINTPKFPAFEWCKTEFWGKFTHFNHVEIARMANKIILDFKAKNG